MEHGQEWNEFEPSDQHVDNKNNFCRIREITERPHGSYFSKSRSNVTDRCSSANQSNEAVVLKHCKMMAERVMRQR